jgi:hypothetical protein
MAKYRCPNCGGEKFHVLVQCWASVTQPDDKNVATYVGGAAPSWSESSRMKCSNCDLEADAYEFRDVLSITPEQVQRFLGALVQLYQTHGLELTHNRHGDLIVRPTTRGGRITSAMPNWGSHEPLPLPALQVGPDPGHRERLGQPGPVRP